MIKSIQDIHHIFYINLDAREDRKRHVEKQLHSIGINHAIRFPAIKTENGAIGCTMSHIECLQIARERDWSHIMIVEDDILFLQPNLFLSQLDKFFQRHDIWDVILLGGNNNPPYLKVDNTCVRVTSCLTTTGYIVSRHYYDILIQNFQDGLNKLITHPHLYSDYAIDKYWFSLQRRDKWYLIIPLTITQREDYSDIEKKQVNYTSLMTDLEKNNYNDRKQIVRSPMPTIPLSHSPFYKDKSHLGKKHLLHNTMYQIIIKKG